MRQFPNPARRNHGYRYGVCHRAGECEVEALLCPVTIHTGSDAFASPRLLQPARPLDGIKPGRVATTVREHFPAWRLVGTRDPLSINGHHNALRAVVACSVFN